MELLNTIFYFVITIGILVFIHELGHFFAAKAFHMRVDRFSIGFPPRAFGKKVGETDYCVSWIPIGGYVKIAGMIDESFDTEHLTQEPQPWEYRAKPIWQRVIVISAGVIMNVVLAVSILWGIIYFQGKAVHPVTAIGTVAPGSAAEKAGLQKDDKILAINGEKVESWDDIETAIYVESLGEDLVLVVLRGGSTKELFIARSEIPSVAEERFGVIPKGILPMVSRVDVGKPAETIGLQPGDVILTVNGEPTDYYSLGQTIKRYALQEVEIEWKRGEETYQSRVIPTEEGRIGIVLGVYYTGVVEHIKYSLFGALVEGVNDLSTMSGLFFKTIYAIVVGKVSFSDSVGGPVRIAQLATQSAEAGFASFLTVMAMLSLSLAILNLLPFPALDGGHLMFLMYEAIFRKEIPTKVKIALQQAGFFLLLVFMAFVIYNDVARF